MIWIVRLIILVEWLIDILKFAVTAKGLLLNRVVFNCVWLVLTAIVIPTRLKRILLNERPI